MIFDVENRDTRKGGGVDGLGNLVRGDIDFLALGTGDFEEFVDEGEEMFSRFRDVFDTFELTGSGMIKLEQLGEAKNDIEGRSEFVTHAGEKFRFGAGGDHRFFVGIANEDIVVFAANGLGEDIGDGLEEVDGLGIKVSAILRENRENSECAVIGSNDDAGATGYSVTDDGWGWGEASFGRHIGDDHWAANFESES